MIPIDAIFFDIDGTLVDSRVDIVKAMNYALRRLGLEERPSDLIVSYIGTGVRDLVRKSVGEEGARLLEQGIGIFSEYYTKHSSDEAKLYPHVEEALIFLKDKKKYILTNRYSRFADLTLKALGIREYFDDIIGGDDDTCLKPSSCILDNVLPRFKLEKARSMIVGDMAIDVMTGINSGIKTCWVTYGLGKPEDMKDLKPDYIIDDISELADIIC